MPHQKSQTATSSRTLRKAGQRPTPPVHDDLFEGYDTSDVDDPMEKDATELELEKLVFGDDAGFQESLTLYARDHVDLEHPRSGDEEKTTAEEVPAIVKDYGALDDADLFYIDSGPSATAGDALAIISTTAEDNVVSDGENQAAWVDSDDERITISLASNSRLRKLRHSEADDMVNGKEYARRLRQQFERLYPVPDWTNASASRASTHRKKRRRTSEDGSSSDDSSADDMDIASDDLSTQPLAKLLQSTDSLTQPSFTVTSNRKKLPPETIEIQRGKDVGDAQPSSITTLSFHPTSPILLSAGPSSLLTLFHVSPHTKTTHPTITTLAIPKHPIHSCAFAAPAGTRIFLSSRRRYFHIWDLSSGNISKVSRIYGHRDEQRSMERFKLSPCGRWMGLVGTGRKGGGVVNVLDANTGQWATQVRVEGRGGVADFAWWGDGEGLVVIGRGGQAVEYGVREKRVLAHWTDDGAMGTTIIALGGQSAGGRGGGLGGNRWMAVGSDCGIVNVYDRSGWSRLNGVPEHPKPMRALDQLVTAITSLLVSPDGQLLVMASREKRDALRLVHLPTCTVYKNWPTSGTPFGRISAVAMSPNSELLAVGNQQGKIRMWEIRG